MRIPRRAFLQATVSSALLLGCQAEATPAIPAPQQEPLSQTGLPAVSEHDAIPLERALARRRSKRRFTDQGLTQAQLGQLLWAAQGITDERGFRAAPSAGALYPLELYVISADGLYHYRPDGHMLEMLSEADMREAAWKAGLEQDALRDAPAVFLFTAVFERAEKKYGQRAERYVYLEAGHAAQNLLLQAVALGLGGVPIGAFHDEDLQTALSLSPEKAPVYLIPVGYPEE